MNALLRRVSVLGALATLVSTLLVTSAHAAAPAAVTDLAARPGVSGVALTWSASARTDHYRACLVVTKTQTRCTVTSESVTEPGVTIRGLTPRSGTDYYARVYSYGDDGRTASALVGFELAPAKPPVVPADVQTVVTTSTLTVTWAASKGADDYMVCLATSTTSGCTRKSTRSANLKATFTGLVPTGGTDYYVRVYAYNEVGHSRTAATPIDLPVSTVRSATMVRTGSGTFRATWSAVTNAEKYELQIADNASMTQGLTTRTVDRPSASPSKIKLGGTYHYRVRATNGVVKGGWSPIGSVRMPSDPTPVRVLTYNLCGQDKCVTKANKMKKWSTRKPIAGKLVRAQDADIIATQESHDKDTKFGSQLPGYALAAYYSAKSLFYDKAKYDLIGSGTITLDSRNGRYAVWGKFRDVRTRTMFIVVDAHLEPYKGKSKDDLRNAQTKVLLSRMTAINAADVPVVYAGDFNSNKSNADQSRYKGGYDAPRKVFKAAGIPDTIDEADNPVHANWNSANQAINPPLKFSDHVDHVYADPEIRVDRWRVVLALTSSRTRYATPFPTDHNPVRVDLTVPGR